MGISTFANNSIKDIRSAGLSVDNSMVHVMQMYTMRDRELQLQIIREAETRGCKAIFLTADSPVLGVRYNEWRNDFRTPGHLEFPILQWKKEDIANRTHDDGFVSFNEIGHSWVRPYLVWHAGVDKC